MANVVFGLFSPFRHEIPEYYGFDVKIFRDNIRFLEILANRGGSAGATCALYFDGAVNFFKELPKPNDIQALNKFYSLIKKIRSN